MNHRIKISIIIFFITTSVLAIPQDKEVTSETKVTEVQMSAAATAKALGWVKDCNDDSVCGGHYFEPSYIVNVPNPELFQGAPVDISASQPAFFTQDSSSILRGDVVLSQPGREITADQMTFFRDEKTKKINRSVLIGNVNFREYGELIIAQKSNLDFINKIYIFNQGVYRFLARDTPTGLANVWGYAKRAISDEPRVLKLSRATYSSCPPDATVWNLWGNKVTLDRNTGRGDVTNAVLFFKKVPVFYSPYFSFSIDKKRKSGFLAAEPSYSNDSGFGIDIPYYFNLAPNYDLTFTPGYFSKRSVLFQGLFRYLTPVNSGKVNISYIPYDRAFADDRKTASVDDPSYRHALEVLKDSHPYRGLIGLENKSSFDEHWRGSLDVNYVTDDYFLQDFGSIDAIDNDQLLNQADIVYESDNWNFLGRLQAFQTLHLITHGKPHDQYKRLPQFNLSGDFPQMWGGIDYRLDSEVVNFAHRDDFYNNAAPPIVAGIRFNVMPSISKQMNWLWGYVIPKIELQATGYGVHDQIKKGASNSVVRLYPMISVDSGSVFARNFNVFRKEYTQTLEPRLFYLLVPMRNQDEVPIFDTYLPAFDFNQLFRTNRFNGIDRVGDANQIALAITTRFIDDSGQERFNAGLGQMFAIRKHQITIDRDNVYAAPSNLDPLKDAKLSPLVGKLQGFINTEFNATLNAAWDPRYQRFNTVDTNLQYTKGPNRVLNLGYHYVIQGDQLLEEKPINFSQIGFSFGWKIWRQWNIIGNLNYSPSRKRAQNYLYGLEYNSCCWALRFASSSDRTIGADNRRTGETKYYLQFFLKGLSNNDFNGLGGAITSQIPGYRDNFAAGGV
ncbi:MAG: LPS-assembly protein LptD [Gammaproteobacteria bacterium]|nr:LPS-assembly protein LptD [Gammaproteobacteria bacterium]